MNTEITGNTAGRPVAGWVCYDGDCEFCRRWMRRVERPLLRHGFDFVPLQTRWERRCLAGESRSGTDTRQRDAGAPGNIPAPVFTEMILELPDGRELGGADAAVVLMRHIWWLWPLWLLSHLPGMMPFYRAVYRRIAAKRHCASGACSLGIPGHEETQADCTAKRQQMFRWADWLPLAALITATIPFRNHVPNWVFMWLFVTAMFVGCKWLTWRRAQHLDSTPTRIFGYFFLWPGMDAKLFLTGKQTKVPRLSEWLLATVRFLTGLVLVWMAARSPLTNNRIADAWLAMFGLTLILHFGLFHLLALAWQRAGVPAKPLMQSPATATSLADFWGNRWNTAFNQLVHVLAFRPLARRASTTWATLGVFAVSGLIHELAISFPARGGYGLPFGYFLLQGIGVLIERSRPGRELRLRHGIRGWLYMILFTAAPAYWLFHPPFVQNVILPMLQSIGAA